MQASGSLPPAIILGGEHNAFSIARSLGAAGITVHAINAPESELKYSRFCKLIDITGKFSRQQDAWADYLLGPQSEPLRDSVLLAACDEGIEIIAKHREALSHKFRLDISNVTAQLGMLNKLQSLIIPYTVLYCPFSIMLLRSYLSTIPKELVEAARVDGASEPWILARVIFPLARPALATVALFCFIWSWNEFLFALVYVPKPDMRTISVGLALLQAVPQFPPEMNIIMAAAAAVTLPVLLLFSVAQRQFIEGMTAGAVK
jgi:hypothetical protein